MSMTDVDQLLERAVATNAVPGIAAAVTTPDGVIYEGAAGSHGGGSVTPVGPETMYRIASMTKALTSTAVMQLVERGDIALEQPAGELHEDLRDLQVLDGFDGDEPRLRAPATPPTIRHLLTHTSGFGYPFINADLLRWTQVTGAPDLLSGVRAVIDMPLLFDPGERFEYGVSTDWLGEIVHAVSGQPLDAHLREHVFGPLGMADATFDPTREQRDRLMTLHARTPGGGLKVSELDLPEKPEIAFGGSGAYATLRDYERFLRALLRGGELDGERILREETVELMFTDHLHGAPLPEVTPTTMPELMNEVPTLPIPQGWGLGFNLFLEDIPGMRSAGSGNWAGLFNCYFWVDRAAGVAGALMTQLLPFFDLKVVETLVGFEQATYAHVRDAAVA